MDLQLVVAILAFLNVSALACRYQKSLSVGEELEIFSPGYPENYPANSNCSWEITAPVGYMINIFCGEVTLQNSEDCSIDQLRLNDETFCQSGGLYATTKSMTNVLHVYLKTESNEGKFYCVLSTVTDPCSCGRRNPSKIVAGTETQMHEFPYQAYITARNEKNERKFLCSCTIISEEYCMTAAHCLTGRRAENIQVVAGDHDISTPSETILVIRDVWKLIIHENYDSGTGKNDIALIRLQTPITYNVDVGPVCLPLRLKDNKLEEKTVTLAGWGATEFGGNTSNILLKVDVNTTTEAKCLANYPGLDDTFICTSGVEKDACQRDSGGSAYYNDDSRVYSVAIITAGDGCGKTGGLNTRVTSQLDWIMDNTVSVLYCTV